MKSGLVFGLILFFASGANTSAEEIPSAPDVQNNLNYVWTLIAAFLVFLMQAGFTMVEVGITHSGTVFTNLRATNWC